MFTDIDWKAIVIPDVPLLETIVRGSAMYLGIFVMLRVILRRQSGTLGMSDLLLITLLADASQNAMAGDYHSLPNGIVLVGTVIFWNFALDWLSYRSPWIARLLEPPPLPLISNGMLLRRNMRHELITTEDLLGQMRQQGVDDFSKVKKAFIESDGRISIICHDEGSERPSNRKRSPGAQ